MAKSPGRARPGFVTLLISPTTNCASDVSSFSCAKRTSAPSPRADSSALSWRDALWRMTAFAASRMGRVER